MTEFWKMKDLPWEAVAETEEGEIKLAQYHVNADLKNWPEVVQAVAVRLHKEDVKNDLKNQKTVYMVMSPDKAGEMLEKIVDHVDTEEKLNKLWENGWYYVENEVLK